MFSLWGQLRLKRILRMAQLPAAHRALQSRAKSVNIMTRDANMFKEGPRGHHHLSSDVRPIYTLVRVHQRVQTTVHHTLPHLWSAKRRPSNDYKCRPTVVSTVTLYERVCTNGRNSRMVALRLTSFRSLRAGAVVPVRSFAYM